MSGFAGKFQRFLSENVPWWLQDQYAGSFLEAIGLTLDDGVQTLITGLRQSNPLQAFVDNLPYIGADRGIRRYPTEPVQSYRSRLQRWRQIRHYSGTHYGEMISLQPYFLPGTLPTIRIVHQAGDGSCATWHTLDSEGTYTVDKATPSNWAYDVSTFEWSRFWVIIEATSDMGVAALYDDGTVYDDGVTVYDGYLTSAQTADIVQIILDSKAAHSALWGVIVVPPGSLVPSGVSAILPDGSESYPDGRWYLEVDPNTGEPTIPDYVSFYYRQG
jgi:hypothetical protein